MGIKLSHVFLPNAHHAVAEFILADSQQINEITALSMTRHANCPRSFCLSVPWQGQSSLLGRIPKRSFFLSVPSEERPLRRAGVSLLRLSSQSSHCSHGGKDSVSPSSPIIYLTITWGMRSGLCSRDITMTSLVNKSQEFSLLSYLVVGKTIPVALVVNNYSCPSCIELVSHLLLDLTLDNMNLWGKKTFLCRHVS